MPLSEEAFTALVDAGCTACRNKRLVIEALVAQSVPLLAGEPFGTPSWGYKGEDLVRGTYRIACDGCKKEIFAATDCPGCGSADGIGRALEHESPSPLPESCARCGSQQLTLTAFVPAIVVYDGGHASKARARAVAGEAGFHPAKAECKGCHDVTRQATGCPICAA
jgi:RNA polymerase subunit RPABC4/transcription elongation factor Spt4